jgi:hypothetical protein
VEVKIRRPVSVWFAPAQRSLASTQLWIGSGSRMHVIDAAETELSRHGGHRAKGTIVQIERATRLTNFFDILDKPAELPLQCSK